ncbi:MAG: hemerythrin domain-containing protein [Thiohalocapsa sp.]
MASAITDSFTLDHQRCDRLLATAESRIGSGDWSAIATAVQALIRSMQEHFRIEEQTLFPRLAEIFLVSAQPIEELCSEHTQMRRLFEDFGAAVEARDKHACAGVLETLHFSAQQHNYKEEAVLYPMADGALRETGAEVAALLTAD